MPEIERLTPGNQSENFLTRNRPRFVAYFALCEVVEGISAELHGHHFQEAFHHSNLLLSLGAAATATAIYDKLHQKGKI